MHDILVPVENRIGEEGEGFLIAMSAIDQGRYTVAAGNVGLAQACLDASVKFFFFKQKTAYEIGLGIPAEPLFRSNLSETAEVPACNVPSRSPLPALAIAPETKLGTASSGLGTLEP